jgi:hypothetical protein
MTAAFLSGRWAYAQSRSPLGDEFSTNTQAYYDQFSTDCSRDNSSPYAGMDPLTCYGVMLPTASNGECIGARGWQLLKQEGNTCYFCQPLDPPINGVIVPIDQLNQARIEGFRCGVDQADPNCMAVCTREYGSGPYIPPGGSNQIPQPNQPLSSGAQNETLSASCGCADSNNPSVCDDGRSLGQRVCIRGYSGDEILCGDPSQFPRGSLLHTRQPSPEQRLADWMLTPDAKVFSDSVTALATSHIIFGKQVRPHKGYMVGLQAQLWFTITRCSNGAAVITDVKFVRGLYRGVQQDPSSGRFSFVPLQQIPPYYDWFMQNALSGATQLLQKNVALPNSCPTNQLGVAFYLKNWDAHLFPGLPVAIRGN